MFEDKASTSLSEAELMERKAVLVAEITRLGEKVGQANDILNKIDANEGQLTVLEQQKAELLASIEETKLKAANELERLHEINATIEAQDILLKELKFKSEEITASNAADASKGAETALKATQELDQLAAKKEFAASEIVLLEEEANAKRSKGAELDSELLALEVQINATKGELEGLKAKLQEVGDSIAEQAALHVQVGGEIGKAKAILARVNDEVKLAGVKFKQVNELISIEESLIADKKAELQTREDAVTVREGEASKKEEWLEKDRKALRGAKEELAAFYKRDIPLNI